MKIATLIIAIILTLSSCSSDCTSTKTGTVESGNWNPIVLLSTGSCTSLNVSGVRTSGCCDELVIILTSLDSEFKVNDLEGNPNTKVDVPANEEIEVTFSRIGYPCSCSDPNSFKYELTLE